MNLSIVIPAYNEEKRLGRCLRYVLRETARYDFPVDVVVVNNASTDGTRDVAESFAGVRVVDERRKGLTAARNAGYHASTGTLIANVDADTSMPKGWIGRVVREFDADDELVALSGPYIYYDLPLHSRVLVKIFYFIGYLGTRFHDLVSGTGSMLQGGNYVVKRSAMESIGGYDLSYDFYGEDTDVAIRIRRVGTVKFTFRLPMYTTGRRLRGEGIVTMGVKYAANYISTTFFRRPFTKESREIR